MQQNFVRPGCVSEFELRCLMFTEQEFSGFRRIYSLRLNIPTVWF